LARRTSAQVRADDRALVLEQKLGKMLLDRRTELRLSQQEASTRAGISQGGWSGLERGASATLHTWSRAAMAVETTLEAYLRLASAATSPRDAAHLRNQELVLRSAAPGRWRGLPEELIDREARTSRAVDVLLYRPLVRPLPDEYALAEVYDWFADVGAALRDWQRRLAALERYAIARMTDDTVPRVAGLWVVRATARNRALVRDHATLFHSRFGGSGRAWLEALGNAARPMPDAAAMVWVSVSGDRLYPARLG
jgi:transcriptional regulator with XRE-family HTH domain